MKRIERPTQVLYIDRQLGSSIACLYLLVVGLVVQQVVADVKPAYLRKVVWLLTGAIGVEGVALMSRKRTFVIDHGSGELSISQTTLFGPKADARVPLAELEVRIDDESVPPPSPAYVRQESYHAKLYRGDAPLVSLAKARHYEGIRELADRFARDLGRPLHSPTIDPHASPPP